MDRVMARAAAAEQAQTVVHNQHRTAQRTTTPPATEREAVANVARILGGEVIKKTRMSDGQEIR